MPPSRYVSSARLMRMLFFLTAAIVVLLLTDVGLRWVGAGPPVRRIFLLAWFVAVPLGWWTVWRRSADPSDH